MSQVLFRPNRGGAEGDKDLMNSIPKPPGTVGKDYSIQIEMGLAGTVKKSEKYKKLYKYAMLPGGRHWANQ